MSEVNQTMGKRIAQLRKNCGFTQEQLAEKLGVSAQAVSKWENDVSCPDISLIPLLASTLGITTDELLGVKPVEPRVVVVEKEPRSEEEKKVNGDWSFDFNTNKFHGKKLISTIIWGILLVAAGVLFLLAQFEVISLSERASFWGIVWPALVIAAGISWSYGSASPLSVGCIVIGAYFFLFNIGVLNFNLTWNMIWPIALILAGLTLLQYLLIGKRKHKIKFHRGADSHGNSRKYEYDDANGNISMDASFGNERCVFTGARLNSAKIDTSFGDYVVDLSACNDFADNAIIDVDVSFGQLTVLLPKTVRLIKNIDNSFAAYTTKGHADENAPFTACIKGDVSFGSLDIKYAD